MNKNVPHIKNIDRSFLPFDYPISDLAFRVYSVFVRVVNDRGVCIHSLDDIGKMCTRRSGNPMNRSSVFRAVSELRYFGLIDDNPSVLSIGQQKPYESHENEDASYSLQPSPESESVVEPTTKPSILSQKPIKEEEHSSEGNKPLSDGQQVVPILSGIRGEGFVLQIETGEKQTDLFVPRRGIFNNINNNKTTTTNDPSLPQREDSDFLVDEFTKRHFPNSPVSIRYCQLYFEGFSERYEIDFDCRAAAMDFLDHWENKKDWLYKRKNDSFPTLITADRVKNHLSTWAGNIRKGWKVYPIGGVKKSSVEENEVGAWMMYGQMNQHAKRLRLTTGDSKFYEHNGKSGEDARWRYIGPKQTSRPKFDTVV